MPVDYSKYAPDWREISKDIRTRRSKGRCECIGECDSHSGQCKAVNYEPHPLTGSKVVLTVAHLDHDISNNNYSNLKAMCQKCHLTYDAKRRRNGIG